MTVHVPDDRATTLRLADVLGSAGFHQAGLQALLEDAMRSVDSDDVAELLRRTKTADQLPVLARLFLTDVGAPIAAAASALRPLPLADLVAVGFLTVDGERVRSCVRLRPVRLAGSDLIVASDRTAGGLSSEHVLGITGAGATLADITYRRRVARALDVGTGCGLQALGAAVHARDVVATDTNPRALAFTCTERDPERRRRRDPARRPACPRLGGVRPDREQPALRHLLGVAVRLPRFRGARRCTLRTARPRAVDAPRVRWHRPPAAQLGGPGRGVRL